MPEKRTEKMKQNLSITITKIRRQKIMTIIAEPEAHRPLRSADDLKFEKAIEKTKRRAIGRAGIGIFVAVLVTAFGILLWRFW